MNIEQEIWIDIEDLNLPSDVHTALVVWQWGNGGIAATAGFESYYDENYAGQDVLCWRLAKVYADLFGINQNVNLLPLLSDHTKGILLHQCQTQWGVAANG